jgi:CheY-like chemotaxis protein
MREVAPNSVLLVDDDTSRRELLARYLEKAGFEAVHAEDGIDALRKLRETLPKVIISDLRMPRMSGVEFTGVVRRRFPTIPVIAVWELIPDDLPAEAQPDFWFDSSRLDPREVVRTVQDLVRKTPDCMDVRQIVTIPVRTGPSLAGYFILTCPDCLRKFRAMSMSEKKAVERTAFCTYCEARVPFLIESSAPM